MSSRGLCRILPPIFKVKIDRFILSHFSIGIEDYGNIGCQSYRHTNVHSYI